jgi:phosphotransferase system enzyme I (PtsI)
MSSVLGHRVDLETAALDYSRTAAAFRRPAGHGGPELPDFPSEPLPPAEALQARAKERLSSELDSCIELSRRYDLPLSVALLNLDDFTRLNARYGRAAGDQALEAYSNGLAANIRKSDAVYSYGPDEFMIVLPGVDASHARTCARRLKKIFAHLPPFSMGIAVYGDREIRERGALLEAARRALNRAKRNGKAHICLFGDKDEIRDLRPAQSKTAAKPKPAVLITGRVVARGIPLAPGLAVGHTFHYRDVLTRELETRDLVEGEAENEMGRLLSAMQRVEEDLLRMKQDVEKQIGSKEAAIFDVHRTILRDLTLIHEIENEIRAQSVNAERVVRDVFRRWEKKFKDSESKTVRERADDVADTGRRLLNVLMGQDSNILANLPRPSVIFARRLLPSDTVHLDRKDTLGIVTQQGGHTSHAAVLARALEVPMISKIDLPMERVPSGIRVLINGDQGTLVFNPTAAEAKNAKEEARKRREAQWALARMVPKQLVTAANEPIRVLANVATPEEIRLAKKIKGDGIGLYRIESIYMACDCLPRENQLLGFLETALRPVRAQEITLRLLDIGGDKMLPYVNLAESEPSELGLRGIRLLLKFPHLLETQVRVFLKLNERLKIKILVPMVSLAEDMIETRKIFEREKQKLEAGGVRLRKKYQLGAMIETPSAVLDLDGIVRHSDFLSIGTNDLLQYTMAADREKISVFNYYQAGNRLILKWIRQIVERVTQDGMECSLCGELAGNLDLTHELLKCGLRRYSVTAHLIPALKHKIQTLIKSPAAEISE